jgi:hypothetical protein
VPIRGRLTSPSLAVRFSSRNITFQKSSPYIEVPAGTYDLELRPARSRTVALEVPRVELSGGT